MDVKIRMLVRECRSTPKPENKAAIICKLLHYIQNNIEKLIHHDRFMNQLVQKCFRLKKQASNREGKVFEDLHGSICSLLDVIMSWPAPESITTISHDLKKNGNIILT